MKSPIYQKYVKKQQYLTGESSAKIEGDDVTMFEGPYENKTLKVNSKVPSSWWKVNSKVDIPYRADEEFLTGGEHPVKGNIITPQHWSKDSPVKKKGIPAYQNLVKQAKRLYSSAFSIKDARKSSTTMAKDLKKAYKEAGKTAKAISGKK